MKSGDVATELDKRIAAALKTTAGIMGPLRGAVERLNDIHNLFRAQLASGKMTDADYAKKARELLNILGNFDGLIVDAVNSIPQQ
ncbi:MAG: hypothetical protein WB691_27145 [Pseudolabrys sp.]